MVLPSPSPAWSLQGAGPTAVAAAVAGPRAVAAAAAVGATGSVGAVWGTESRAVTSSRALGTSAGGPFLPSALRRWGPPHASLRAFSSSASIAAAPLVAAPLVTAVAGAIAVAAAASAASGDGATGPTMEQAAAGMGAEGAPLKEQKCIPCHQKNLEPLSREEAEALHQKDVPAWQLVDVEGVPRLRRSWKTKNFLTGLTFFQRIADIAEAEGHHPDLHLEGWNNARVEIFTHSINGLNKNDFILAAKIDALDVADLMRKPKKSLAQSQ